MEFKPLAPSGPVTLVPRLFGDDRGYFMETFRQNDFAIHCGEYSFVQDNQSKSRRNVLRGMHYQLKYPQGKLARVISGRVFDAVVDLRQNSPTFGKSFSVVLDAERHHSLWVPPGFAHGFLVLSEEAEFIYKCTEYYHPEDEHCLLWNDPRLEINWPLENGAPLISPKDAAGKSFAECAKYASL